MGSGSQDWKLIWPALGTVDRHGPCQMVPNIMKPVFKIILPDSMLTICLDVYNNINFGGDQDRQLIHAGNDDW